VTTRAVAVVIAAYRPEASLADRVAVLREQCGQVVVVDDGSPDGFRDSLRAADEAGAVVLKLPSNRGIAGALNAGIAFAEERWRPQFYATFDQDSTPVADYLLRAIETFDQAVRAGAPVGFVAASSYNGLGCILRRSKYPVEVAFDPIQSGFVIPAQTLMDVGRFDEGLVIDGVDSEFTARVRAAGLVPVVGRDCEIKHSLGRRSPAMLFGRRIRLGSRQVTYNYHAPQRVYYMMRNGTVLSLRYFIKDPAWVARRLYEEMIAHSMRLAFSPDRSALLLAMVAGLRDALLRRSGPIPTDLQLRLSSRAAN
jgi:rhamnosyltransferase